MLSTSKNIDLLIRAVPGGHLLKDRGPDGLCGVGSGLMQRR